MSSVGSADKRASQDEALRRARDTYQEKETDQAKSHAAELKRMTEAHRAEMREMEEVHAKQMEDLKAKTRDVLSERDMRYQKEMEDLRGMHANQVRRQASEADNRLQKAQDTAKATIDHTNIVKDQQRDVMARQYEEQISDGKRRYEEMSTKSREMGQEAAATQRERLNRQHEKEIDLISADRDRTRAQAQKDYEGLRKAKDTQFRDFEQAKNFEVDRITQTYETNLRESNTSHNDSLDRAREDMQAGVQKNRERYEKALEDREKENHLSTQAFKSDISDRINDRLNNGKAENTHLRNELTRQQVRMNRQKNREVDNVRTAMQANVNELEDKRLETLDAANAKSKQEVDHIQKQSSDILNRTNRFYQDKIVSDRNAADDRHDRTKMNLEKRLQLSEINADDRANKLMAINEREEENLRNFFDKSSVAQRENFASSLRELRDTNKRDQDTMIQNFTRQANDREMKYQTKLTDTTNKYESQLQQVKEENAKMLQEQQAISNKEKKVIVDQKNGEIQRQASQFENRIAKLEETHKREVDAMNRRHDDSITTMTRSKGRP